MSSELLNGYTERIKRYEKDIQHNYIQIAMNLYEIQEFNFLKDSEYKNIYDYALNEFGFEKSKTNELINIYKKFFFEERKAKIGILTYGNYSISQLKYMLNMSEEQLKQCDPKLSVKAIKLIRLNSSTRVNNETIDNTEKLENKNIIKGVFPEKKEEEKQNTLIIAQLPKYQIEVPSVIETKTIITETTSSQNNDFVPKVELTELDTLRKINNDLKTQYFNNQDAIKELKQEIDTYKDMFNYIYKELFESVRITNFDYIADLVYDLNEFRCYQKLPKKIKFMKEVI